MGRYYSRRPNHDRLSSSRHSFWRSRDFRRLRAMADYLDVIADFCRVKSVYSPGGLQCRYSVDVGSRTMRVNEHTASVIWSSHCKHAAPLLAHSPCIRVHADRRSFCNCPKPAQDGQTGPAWRLAGWTGTRILFCLGNRYFNRGLYRRATGKNQPIFFTCHALFLACAIPCARLSMLQHAHEMASHCFRSMCRHTGE